KIITAFQSRFGPKRWLQPYTSETIGEMVAQGSKNLMVITPGFATDCLETIEEIGVELCDEFHALGGKNYHRVSCLNDTDDHIAMLAEILGEPI
ncbi:MAG: ferrochelatase, partial [Pseudomonadota bacterium]